MAVKIRRAASAATKLGVDRDAVLDAERRLVLAQRKIDQIESDARHRGAVIAGRIRYDTTVTRAQVEGRTVVELGGDAADDIRNVWKNLQGWVEA